MKKIFLLILFTSCSSSRDITGFYKTDDNNVININLTLDSDKKFWLTYKASMVTDSIFGNYEVEQNKIHLYSKTKELNLVIIRKKKADKNEATNLSFKQSDLSFAPNFYMSELIINVKDSLKIFSEFDVKPIEIHCKDELIYKYDNLSSELEIDDCNYDYDIFVYIRDERTIIPSNMTFELPRNNRIKILGNNLKKRKHNTVYN